MKNIKTVVSVVNWNNSQATNKCLRGIAALPKNKQPDVIVIDNHSTQDEFRIDSSVRESLRSLDIVKNKANLGFAGGHNPSIKKAFQKGYDYIFLVNNDSEIIDAEIFELLAKALENNPKALGANPTILSSLDPDIIWYGGGKLSLVTGRATHLLVGRSAESVPKKVQDVTLLTGGCLAISLKRSKLEDLVLPEPYFVYWEDTEWCARTLRAGFKLLYVPQARLLHQVSSSLGVRSPAYIYYNIRNHRLFIKRNIAFAWRPLAYVGVLVIIFKYKLAILLGYRQERRAALKALAAGWRDGRRGVSGKLGRSL